MDNELKVNPKWKEFVTTNWFGTESVGGIWGVFRITVGEFEKCKTKEDLDNLLIAKLTQTELSIREVIKTEQVFGTTEPESKTSNNTYYQSNNEEMIEKLNNLKEEQ